MTYGRGLFYKGTGLLEPEYRYDLYPKVDNVTKCDCREMPIESGALDCVMFDPPFLATSGKSLTSDDDNNRINKWYGVYRTEKDLHRFYVDSMAEAYRVLKKDGVLIFKCQDKASHGGSGRQYMSHVYIHNEAVKIGFYPKDLFVLLANVRLVANWQAAAQKHARKYHCYFWVFQKRNWKISYL